MRSKVGSIELNFVIDGKPGLPWLIFSNSVATDTSLWDNEVSEFSDRYRILRYDHRGHGLSDAPAEEYSIDMLAEDLKGLLVSLSIEKATLIGISMGGMTVLTFAKKYPHMVEKLVVCDCGPAASPTSAQQWKERAQKVSDGGMDALVNETLGRWFRPETVERKAPVTRRVATMIRDTPMTGFIGSTHALSTFDLREGLESLAVPTLFLAGEQDAVVNGTRNLSESVPNSRFEVIPRAGHLCNLENPKEFISVVNEFLMGA